MNIWEDQAVFKAVYTGMMEPVCVRYGLTGTELAIIMFLANNPQYDTATDIVEVRHIVKSHVSVSLRRIEKLGYIRRAFADGNRKTVHITLCEKADAVIEDGRRAQKRVMETLFAGISEEELAACESCIRKIVRNAESCVEREKG